MRFVIPGTGALTLAVKVDVSASLFDYILANFVVFSIWLNVRVVIRGSC